MQTSDREMAKKMAAKISYADIFKPGEFKIEALWRTIVKKVLPEQISQIQHDEMRKAFYMGFTEAFRVLTDYAGDLPEEKACQMFGDIAQQLNDFADKVMRDLN